MMVPSNCSMPGVFIQLSSSFVSGHARLDVEQPSWLSGIRIMDASHSAMGCAEALLRADQPGADVDLDAEIRAAFSHPARQRLEFVLAVFLAVNGDDIFAPPLYELVQSEILEVASIGKA